ncbi:Formyltransferase [Trametes cingulata]|nr:Formyltransferase [Trametes cingulata]
MPAALPCMRTGMQYHVLPTFCRQSRLRLLTRRCRSFSTTADAFKILFFGRDEFSCGVLRQLLDARDVWQEIVVVTQPDTKTGRRGSKLSISPLKLLAEKHTLRFHTIPHERSEFKHFIPPSPFAPPKLHQDISLKPPPEHLLVTASFGRILPNSLLSLFLPERRLNVHPSLLPSYRGAAPIQHALIDGQRETGVCVIEMTERKKGIDSGAIWSSRKMTVPEGATFPALRDSLSVMGGQLLVATLRDMLARKDTRVPQPDDPYAPRAPLITMQDSCIDFRTMSAEQIVRRHRAVSHQKPLTTLLQTQRTLQLHEPSVLEDAPAGVKELLPVEGTAVFHPPSKALVIRCAGETYLSVPMVRQQDRHLLKAKEWWNGVKPEMRLGRGPEGPVQFIPFDSSPP